MIDPVVFHYSSSHFAAGDTHEKREQADIGHPVNAGNLLSPTSLPAWDADLAVFGLWPRWKGGSLLAVTTEKYLAFRATPPPKLAPGVKPKPPDIAEVKLWASPEGTPAAFALAKDAVVAAFVNGGKVSHKLTAFKRADGSMAWSVDLPEQPAMTV